MSWGRIKEPFFESVAWMLGSAGNHTSLGIFPVYLMPMVTESVALLAVPRIFFSGRCSVLGGVVAFQESTGWAGDKVGCIYLKHRVLLS